MKRTFALAHEDLISALLTFYNKKEAVLEADRILQGKGGFYHGKMTVAELDAVTEVILRLGDKYLDLVGRFGALKEAVTDYARNNNFRNPSKFADTLIKQRRS